jgi:hypothetical protein
MNPTKDSGAHVLQWGGWLLMLLLLLLLLLLCCCCFYRYRDWLQHCRQFYLCCRKQGVQDGPAGGSWRRAHALSWRRFWRPVSVKQRLHSSRWVLGGAGGPQARDLT